MNRLIRTKLTGIELLRLAWYFVTVAIVGFLAMARLLTGASLPSWASIVIYGIAGLVAYNVVFVLPTGVRLMPGTPILITALYVHGLPLALLAVLPSLLLHFFTHKNGFLNCLFNVGQMSLSLIAADRLARALGWAPGVDIGARALAVIPLMVCAHELVNYGLVSGATALEHKEPFLPWFLRVAYEDRAYAIPTIYSVSTIGALLTYYMGHEGTIVVLVGVFAIFTQSRLLKDYATKSLESRTDALTGLYNLRYLDDWLEKELREDSVVSVLFVDVDGLKGINDTYGHAAGDSVLIQLGAYLVRKMGRENVMRYGGDEFVLLYHEKDTSSAAEFARRTLCELQESPPVYNGMPVKCGLSFGIATFPVHSTIGRELVRLADRAMYLAKRGGGNSVYVADSL